MAGTVVVDGPSTTQVFVDGSGRRARVTRRVGVLVGAVSALYVATVAAGLTQTGVGPLPGIPATGNGLVPGFAGNGAAVPGLLALGAHPAQRPEPARGVVVRSVATHRVTGAVVSAVDTRRSGRASSSGGSSSSRPSDTKAAKDAAGSPTTTTRKS